jgi:hypothetical protein
LYRPAGQEEWLEGLTANISPSGVLIVGDLPVDCEGSVAVVIALPQSRGCLTGHGRIARVGDADSSLYCTFAIAVSQFALARQAPAPAHLHDLHQGC